MALAGLSLCLASVVVCASCEGAALWVYGGNSVETLENATGMSSAGRGFSTDWKNAQLHVEQADDVDVGWRSLGVIAARDSYSRESWSLIGLGDIFGSATNAIPIDAKIRDSWLWVYVDQAKSPPLMALAGLAADQHDWTKGAASWRYKNVTNRTPWRYSGKLGPDIVKEYGTFTPPAVAGWYQVPVSLSNALNDIRRNEIGGLVLIPVEPERPEISTWYVSSDSSPLSERRPGVFVDYETGSGVFTNLFIAHDGQTPLTPYTNWLTAASNISEAVAVATTDSTLHFAGGAYGQSANCGGLTYRWQAEDAVSLTGTVQGTGGAVFDGAFTFEQVGSISSGWMRVESGALAINGQARSERSIEVAADSELSGSGAVEIGLPAERLNIAEDGTLAPAPTFSVVGSVRLAGTWLVNEKQIAEGTGVQISGLLELEDTSILQIKELPDEALTYLVANAAARSGQFGSYDLPRTHTLFYRSGELTLIPGVGILGSNTMVRSGGTLTIELEASDQTGWVAVSTSSWIKVVSGKSGTGNGTIELEIERNRDRERSSTVWIAGMEYTITQQAGTTCYLDYDGDGIADVVTFWAEEGMWTIFQSATQTERIQPWGWVDCQPVVGDYDGDGCYDITVYHPQSGMWYCLESSTMQGRIQPWGYADAMPVPGDYDGDGETDFAVYDAARGTWFIEQSSSGTARIQTWGWEDAMPVAGDFDGDGTTDMAVYWAEGGQWYILQSSDNTGRIQPWGREGAEACQGDFDGDGITDVAVYWPDNGGWDILRSSDGRHHSTNWGWNKAWPQQADFDGDSIFDITVYWPGERYWFTWFSASQSPRILQQNPPEGGAEN